MKSLGSFIKLYKNSISDYVYRSKYKFTSKYQALQLCYWWSETSLNRKLNCCPSCSSGVIIDQCWIHYFLLKLKHHFFLDSPLVAKKQLPPYEVLGRVCFDFEFPIKSGM